MNASITCLLILAGNVAFVIAVGVFLAFTPINQKKTSL